MAGRIGLTDVRPVVSAGNYPACAVVGEDVTFSAVAFREGHEAVCADLVLRPPGAKPRSVRMSPPKYPGTDLWTAVVPIDRPGMWHFTVEAWGDPLESWHHAVTVKLDAGQDAHELANDLFLGARLLDRTAQLVPKADRGTIIEAADALRDEELALPVRVGLALDPQTWALIRTQPIREFVTKSAKYSVWVDRTRALTGSWYEFFPRSLGSTSGEGVLKHGTFADAAAHLDYVEQLGFDVVYLPPIHPIGITNRKGPNNTLLADLGDVGSPWAIGSTDGGHDALHPELGTMADFKSFVAKANARGMEVALDFALQCSPDHPWVSTHPEWFTTRPDGSIAYAENPPKKYQDIYPLNFDNDPKGLYAECLRILTVWIEAGVRIFRVDNPHTKPLNFWQWLITETKSRYPDVLFLAEAFTKPAMMHELARIGFTQSYTYYTWRDSPEELRKYVTELVEAADYMRPNFFTNTPDILTEYLQTGGPAAFKIRAILAATLSPTWGVYSGYELMERRPVRPGSEEYLDSEKYQLRPRDFEGAIARGESIAPLLAHLNTIRREHPALQWLRNITFHDVDTDGILVFSKVTGEDRLIVACSTDPHHMREGWLHLDMAALGLPDDAGFQVHDLLNGARYDWGQHNFVRLDPGAEGVPAHILHVTT